MMMFEWALSRLKGGARVRNAHWPEGMFIFLQPGYPEGIPINKNTAKALKLREGTVKSFRPYIMLHCVDGSFVPWVATQSDILSEVWQVITGNTDEYAAPFGIHVNRCKGPDCDHHDD